jgi:gamma-tubulin complex component 3
LKFNFKKKIFTNEVISKYLRVFNFLWRVKRLEYKTCGTWKSHKANMEKFRSMSDIYEIIHQGNIISSGMLRLLQNLNFYIMFEVLEVSWKNLCEQLQEAKDMDHVIAATDHFLNVIVSQLLLDPESEEISKELRAIFDLIIKMSMLNEQFYDLALREYNTRKLFREDCKRRQGNQTDV